MPIEAGYLQKQKIIETIETKDQSKSMRMQKSRLSLPDISENQESLQENYGFEVITSDQIEEIKKENMREPAVSFSIKGSIIRENDSSKMRSIKLAITDYYKSANAFGQIPATQEKLEEKLAASEELVNKAQEIISICKWYCFFRHPFSTEGKQRKKDVIALRNEVEQHLDLLRMQFNTYKFEQLNIEHKNRTADPVAKKINFINKPNGNKLIDMGGKKMTYEPTDLERLKAKEFLAEQVNLDRLTLGKRLGKKVDSILSMIKNYSAIHTTAMHYKSSRRLMNNSEGKEAIKHKKKMNIREKKLKEEIELATTIKSELEVLLADETLSMEQRNALQRYKTSFDSMTDGNLKDDPQAEHIDFSKKTTFVRTYVTNDSERKKDKKIPIKLETNELEMQDRSKEPLFAHEPCTQDIAQLGFGDCYFLSALSKFVAEDANAVKNIMKDNGNSVTVRFYRYDGDDKMIPVHVTVPKVSTDQSACITLWVQVMETAFAAFNQSYSNETPSRELIIAGHKPKESELDYGYMADGGKAAIVFRQLTGKIENDCFQHLGKPSALDEGMIDDPRNVVKIIYSRSSESTGLLKEREELDKNAATLEQLEQKIILSQGVFRENASEEDKNKYLSIMNAESKHLNKALQQKMYCFTGMVGGTAISFGEINKRLKAFNDKYLKSLPPNAEQMLYEYNKWQHEDQRKLQKVVNNREEEFFKEKYPELANDYKKIKGLWINQKKRADFAKTNPEDYEKYKQYLEALKLDKKYLEAKKNSADAQKKAQETGVILGNQQIMQFYGYANEEGKPGDTLKNKQKDRISQISALSDDSYDMQKYVGKKFGIKLEEGNKNPQVAKKNYETILEGIKNLTYEDAGDKVALDHMLLTPYDINDMEHSRREAFTTVKMHATMMLESILERFDDIHDVEQLTMFTGKYSKESLEAYRIVEEAIKDGKMICAGTRQDAEEGEEIGASGEVMLGGIASNHAYAILDAGEFDYNGKKLKMIKVRNPWGGYAVSYEVNKEGKVIAKSNNGKTNGEFWMELTHFTTKFDVIHLGTKAA